jgi:hypothetical protein
MTSMSDPTDAAGAALAPKTAKPKAGPAWLVQPAPTPELPDARDRKGAQAGMGLALIGGGVFWAAVIGAAAYFLRR